MRKISTALTLGVSTIALSNPVFAQDAEVAAADTEGSAEPETQDAIIVTADRREQNLQSYAGTAAVFSGEEMRAIGIQDITDFNNQLPGLTVANNGGNVEIWIRGVGSSNNTELGDPAAAFHYDGVYVPRPAGIGSAFFDIERVEVNLGPQGTLRGRNAMAGSVNAIAWKPGLGVWDAELEVGYGNYDHKEFRGMINVPIGDTMAFRFAGMYLGHDSYYNNVGPIQNIDVAEAEDNKAFRAQFLWEPDDRLSILLAGDYIHEEGTGYTGTNYANPLGNGIDPRDIKDPRDVIANAFTPILDNKHWGLRATVAYETEPFTIEFTTSYRDLVADYDATTPLTPFYPGVMDNLAMREDVLAAPLPDGSQPFVDPDIVLNEVFDNWSRFQSITDSESYFNELRIFNSDGPFIWSLGGMYFKEDQRAFLGSTGDRGLFFQGVEFVMPDVDAESWALYGDATWEVSERFRVTAGIRYTDDEKSRQGVAVRYGLALGGGSFECCGGARYGTEGFEFAAFDRTLFSGDIDSDGTITTQEIFDFWLNGVAQFGLRDNVDDILLNGPKGFYLDGTTPCIDTVTGDAWSCNGFTNDDNWFGSGLPGNADPIRFTYAVPFEGQIFQQNGAIADNFVDWRLRFEYDLTSDNLIYALVASGHKSGTFNDNLGDNGFVPTTDTENVILYEVGTKNEFWVGDVRARVNGSAFYNDYKDQAFSALVAVDTIVDFETDLGNTVDLPEGTSGQLVVGYNFNAADSEIYGINVEGGLQLPAGLNWDFNALWLEAKIKDAIDIPDFRYQSDVDAENAVFRPITGNRMPRTPRWQLNTSISQNIDVPSGSLDWVISAGYRSSTFQTIFNSIDFNPNDEAEERLNDVVTGYWTFDLGAGYSHGDGRFRFEVFANNLTNKQKEAAIIITQFDNTRFFTRPRTLGARLRVRL